MEIFSTLQALVRGIHQSPMNAPQKPVTRSFDVFFDLCMNNNNCEAGDLRHHRAHFDVIIMINGLAKYL